MSTNATFCPHCGEDVPEANKSFCSQCGASLLAMVADTECPNCQEPVQDTDIYCRHCRYFVSMNG
jgi:predicted amidophosphoribosyltransferase